MPTTMNNTTPSSAEFFIQRFENDHHLTINLRYVPGVPVRNDAFLKRAFDNGYLKFYCDERRLVRELRYAMEVNFAGVTAAPRRILFPRLASPDFHEVRYHYLTEEERTWVVETLQTSVDTNTVEILRELAEKRIGEVGLQWNGLNLPIEYKYAKLQLNDVFDFYTNGDGVMQFPKFLSFKYVVDQFLEEDPRIKYHPTRVRQFIDNNGIEQLEHME